MADFLLERVVTWRVNGVPQHAFLCTPEHLDELALGHLLANGLIGSASQAAQTAVTPLDGTDGIAADVAVTLADGAALHHRDIVQRLHDCAPVSSVFTIARDEVTALCTRLLQDEDYFGTHRLMLHTASAEAFREDAGRHNAADKLIGWAAMNGVDFSRSVLGATGRISLEMLAKAAQMGIPVFFSRKYPSDLAVSWADQLGIALVSRAHSGKMDVYGAAWRVR